MSVAFRLLAEITARVGYNLLRFYIQFLSSSGNWDGKAHFELGGGLNAHLTISEEPPPSARSCFAVP